MEESQSLSHTKWDCKSRMVFIFDVLRRHLGQIFQGVGGPQGVRRRVR
jgi:hypothetical protein